MKTFRSTVMHRAYHLLKTTGKDWAVCLKKAWLLFRLNRAMKKDTVTFYFEKKDGTPRRAVGTLNISYEHKTDKEPNPAVFTYFDTEKNAFRCFKVENFLIIENAA